MQYKLNNEFLISIVVIEEFDLHKKSLDIEVTCIEDNIDVSYCLKFSGIVAFIFRQEEADEMFEVVDVFLEKFNDCPYLAYMESASMEEYSALRFHSGTHHLVVGFKDVDVLRR